MACHAGVTPEVFEQVVECYGRMAIAHGHVGLTRAELEAGAQWLIDALATSQPSIWEIAAGIAVRPRAPRPGGRLAS